MTTFRVFRPAAVLMRRLRLGHKLALLMAAMVLALVTVALAQSWGAGAVWLSCVVGVVSLVYLLGGLWSSLQADVAQLRAVMHSAAEGDLCRRCDLSGRDEFAALGHQLDAMVLTLSAMVANIRSNAALVADAGRSLVEDNQNLSERTDQQAANLEQTAGSVQQLLGAVGENTDTAATADRRALQVRQSADEGVRAMASAVRSIDGIQGDARRMSEIIGVIDGIAFQTNILALNAAVEAARAGEQGRSFAVVASEVRSLAGRSAEAAREIRKLIGTSVQQIESSVGLIRAAEGSMVAITEGIHGVAAHVSQIAQSAQEQGLGLQEIDAAVQQLEQITQHNARMGEQALHEARALQQRASTLAQAVHSFRLQQGTADEAVALVEQAAQLHGRCAPEVFLRTLSDPAQAYCDRDMYVFVLDASGAYLAFGGNPARVGTRVQDVAGVDGERLLADIIAQAERGPGWVEYDYVHPTNGSIQTKMSFVQRAGNGYLGCGVYKTLQT